VTLSASCAGGKLNLSGGEMTKPDPSTVAVGRRDPAPWLPLQRPGRDPDMRLRRAAPLILILAALSLAACGSDSGSDSTAGGATAAGVETVSPPSEGEGETAPSGEAVRSAKVEIGAAGFEPATVTIQAGGKVTWQNEDSAEHTITLDDGSFDSGPLGEGKLKSQSFKRAGTFTYHSEDPSMTGTVEVVEPE
jgi:plastocyanin